METHGDLHLQLLISIGMLHDFKQEPPKSLIEVHAF